MDQPGALNSIILELLVLGKEIVEIQDPRCASYNKMRIEV